MNAANPAPSDASAPRWGRTLFNLFFASFGYVAIRMLIAPVRIKLLTSLLTKEDYGRLTLIMLTVSFLTLIFSLGSLEYMLRKLPGRPAADQYRTLRTVMSWFGRLAAAVALAGAALLLIWQPGKVGLSPHQVAACALILFLTVHLTQIVYFLMGRSQYAQSRLMMLLYADAWFLPLLGFMWWMPVHISFMLWLWTVWLAGSLAVALIWVKPRDLLAQAPSRPLLRDILRFGIPLMPMIMGEWIFQMQDRYILLAFTDLETVADYTLCFNLAWAGAATGTALLDLLITEFYKARNRVPARHLDDLTAHAPLRKAFTMMLRYGLLLGLPIVLALWIARDPIVRLLSSPQFAQAIPLMRWVAPLPGLYLLVIIAGRTLVAMDRGTIVGIGTLCAAGVNLILSLLLTPWLAARGVALSGCLAYGGLALYLGFRARLWCWVDWTELHPGRLLAFVLLCTGALHGAVAGLPGHPLAALLLAGAACLAAMPGLGLARLDDIRHLLQTMHAPVSEPGDGPGSGAPPPFPDA